MRTLLLPVGLLLVCGCALAATLCTADDSPLKARYGSDRERIRREQAASGLYPPGQYIMIYSDDIEAVKQERQGTITRIQKPGGGRYTTEEAPLNQVAEQMILKTKLEKQLRDFAREMQERNEKLVELRSPSKSLETYRLRMERTQLELEKAQREYRKVSAEWTGNINPACSDGLTYQSCSCSGGALLKRFKLMDLRDAESDSEDAERELESKRKEYDEQEEKDRKFRVAETTRLNTAQEQATAAQNQAKQSLETVQSRLNAKNGSAQSPKASTNTAAPRIEFDDSIPKRRRE
jgi:hypothetical protein